jgi:hypothetical protein
VSCDIEDKKEKPWRNNSKSLALVFFVLCFRQSTNIHAGRWFFAHEKKERKKCLKKAA